MEVQQSLVYYLDPSASDQSYLEMLIWLRSNGADGLFSTSDALTLGIVKAAQEMGLRIPEDMKLIGYDVNSMFEYVYPSISTIVQPVEEMCDLTVELLCSMMEGKCPSENCFCLPVEAVCRRSTE